MPADRTASARREDFIADTSSEPLRLAQSSPVSLAPNDYSTKAGSNLKSTTSWLYYASPSLGFSFVGQIYISVPSNFQPLSSGCRQENVKNHAVTKSQRH